MKDKEKKAVNEKGAEVGGVRLRVSEPSLAEGVKTLENPTFKAAKNLKQSFQRKTSGNAMKDVTNKMETDPIKFKSYWNGPRAATRDISTGKKRNTEVGPKSLVDTATKTNSNNVNNGPYSASQPEPVQSVYKLVALNKPQFEASGS